MLNDLWRLLLQGLCAVCLTQVWLFLIMMMALLAALVAIGSGIISFIEGKVHGSRKRKNNRLL